MAHLVLSRIEALHANTQLFFQITTVTQHRQSEIRMAWFFVHLIPRIIYDTWFSKFLCCSIKLLLVHMQAFRNEWRKIMWKKKLKEMWKEKKSVALGAKRFIDRFYKCKNSPIFTSTSPDSSINPWVTSVIYKIFNALSSVFKNRKKKSK